MTSIPSLTLTGVFAVSMFFSAIPAEAAESPTLEQKAAAIILPRVQFNGASLDEALAFLRVKALEADPTHDGLNIVAYAKVPEARFSFDLADVSLKQVLEQIADHAGLQLRYAHGAAVFEARDASPSPAAAKGDTSESSSKAAAIVLPSVRFANATLEQAVEFLRGKARAQNPDQGPINIAIRSSPEAAGSAISLDLQDITLLDALHHCSAQAGFMLTEEGNVIVLAPIKQ